ncbi:MAG: FtsX-like permease family protein [Candidatus Pacebacteria bacterium]|nr:FtsX-like permease family protein [Candidatus Paceibacterota bacterium]
MQLRNTIIIALKSLSSNKLRTFLTMLGIIIGVSSVIALTSIGKGVEVYLNQQFESLGSNTIEVNPGPGLEGGFSAESQFTAYENNPLRLKDAAEISELTEYVSAVCPANLHIDEFSFQSQSKNLNIMGVSHQFSQVFNIKTQKGQFYSETDDQKGAKVAVIGHAVAEEFFGKLNPVGRKAKIGSSTFKIIGVAEEQGGSFGLDTYVYIPIKTAIKLYDDEKIIEIDVKIKDKELVPKAIEEIEKKLLKRLDEDDFSIIDHAEALKMVNEILGVLTIGLGAIAAISLVVGGIGIMNIMLVSVTERTKEIGLRKAVGATPNQILAQFLTEAALLSISGGLIGLGLVSLAVWAIQTYFPATITMESVILAFGVSTLIGLVFGAAPAKKAAQLPPVEALLHE